MDFQIKDSGWRSQRPSAYYFDDINEFLASQVDFNWHGKFSRNFLQPLTVLYRKKYYRILNSDLTESDEAFLIEIPYRISEKGRIAFDWYIRAFPDGEFIKTAKDFIAAMDSASLSNSLVLIVGE